MARDYQKGKIYMIWSGDERYYGSTTDTLSKRMVGHRGSYKANPGKTTAHKLFDTYGVENCKIELVEEFPCNSKDELLAREGVYIRENNCVNKVIPGRTKAEYYAKWEQDNKEYLNEYRAKYYQYNKEHIAKYYQDNKEYLNESRAKWEQDNKEYLNEYRAKYRQDHKDHIKEYNAKYRQLKKNSTNIPQTPLIVESTDELE